jgi:hypothetical protein
MRAVLTLPIITRDLKTTMIDFQPVMVSAGSKSECSVLVMVQRKDGGLELQSFIRRSRLSATDLGRPANTLHTLPYHQHYLLAMLDCIYGRSKASRTDLRQRTAVASTMILQ